jgi:uncharacterized protein
MIIPIDEIPQSPKEIRFAEKIGDLNDIYSADQNRDFNFPPSLEVDLTYYRSGCDIFFHGSLGGSFEGQCSRCLRRYAFSLDKEFDFVLVPNPADTVKTIGELSRDELGLSYYSNEEINLTPLIKEQVLLALPTRPLCAENCRGLCDRCGANLNIETCGCVIAGNDPRMAIFRTLKVSR